MTTILLLLASAAMAQDPLPAATPEAVDKNFKDIYFEARNADMRDGGEIAGNLITSSGTTLYGPTTFYQTVNLSSPVAVGYSAPSTPTANTIYADLLVKGWAHFTGTGTVTLQAGVNISSITDIGTGEYMVNFARDFADTFYVASCYCITGPTQLVCGVPSGGGSVIHRHSFRVTTLTTTGAQTDCERVMVMFIGVQ